MLVSLFFSLCIFSKIDLFSKILILVVEIDAKKAGLCALFARIYADVAFPSSSRLRRWIARSRPGRYCRRYRGGHLPSRPYVPPAAAGVWDDRCGAGAYVLSFLDYGSYTDIAKAMSRRFVRRRLALPVLLLLLPLLFEGASLWFCRGCAYSWCSWRRSGCLTVCSCRPCPGAACWFCFSCPCSRAGRSWFPLCPRLPFAPL